MNSSSPLSVTRTETASTKTQVDRTSSRLKAAAWIHILLLSFGSTILFATSLQTGRNDFRISVSLDGAKFDRPTVAYNSILHEYLAAWINSNGELRTSRIAPDDGAAAASVLIASGARSQPDLIFNPTRNQYFIVWQDVEVLTNDAIRGAWLSTTGSLISSVEISDEDGFMSVVTDSSPTVVLKADRQEYLVSWLSDDCVVVARILSNGGVTPDLCVNLAFDSTRPALAYNPQEQEYLLVWDSWEFVNGVRQFEIFARRLDGVTVYPVGQFIIVSHAGGFDDDLSAATEPAVTYNSKRNEYMVVWRADDSNAGLADGEFEIFSKRITASGAGGGAKDNRVSFVGGTGSSSRDADAPTVRYDAATDTYVVAWNADDPYFGQSNNDWEIYMRILDGEGMTPRTETMRLSDVGPIPSTNSDPAYDAVFAHLALRGTGGGLVVWWAYDRVYGATIFDYSDRAEIFGQRILIPSFADGFESGSLSSWNAN